MLSRHFGLLIIFVVAAVVNYYVVCFFVFLPIVFLIFFTFLPNTPQFYLQKGQTKVDNSLNHLIYNTQTINLQKKKQNAEQALKWYKGYKGDSEQEKIALEKEFARLQLLAKEQKEDDKIRFSDFGNDVFLVFLILPDVYYEWYPILFFFFLVQLKKKR